MTIVFTAFLTLLLVISIAATVKLMVAVRRVPVQGPVRVGRIKQAKLRCRICKEPLEHDDIVFFRDDQQPWHARHKVQP